MDIATPAAPHYATPAAIPQAIQASAPVAWFGGPDQPPRALRDMLKARIEAAPPGSEIDWATYYFRDQDLADALLAANRRGVKVRVSLEAKPRLADTNQPVIDKLARGLGQGLRLHKSEAPLVSSHLHAKIYAFSGPQPVAFVGSFNPSGDLTPNPEVIAAIGDQDSGHNVLVEINDPKLVGALADHARQEWKASFLSRLSPSQNKAVSSGPTTVYFYPRMRTDVVERSLVDLGPGDSLKGAISHLKWGPLAERMAEAARRGADIELVVHDTERRVPDAVVERLTQAGVHIHRYRDEMGWPMHAKILVVTKGGEQAAWFGSFNFNSQSRWLNQEVLVRSVDPKLVHSLDARMAEIVDAATSQRLAHEKGPTQVALRLDEGL